MLWCVNGKMKIDNHGTASESDYLININININ
jgi:hypothetical protein